MEDHPNGQDDEEVRGVGLILGFALGGEEIIDEGGNRYEHYQDADCWFYHGAPRVGLFSIVTLEVVLCIPTMSCFSKKSVLLAQPSP